MIPVSLAIAVMAHKEQSATQVPWIVHAIKNWAISGFMVVNRLSFPSLAILKNKKDPKRTAHKITKIEIVNEPQLISPVVVKYIQYANTLE